MRSKIAEVSGVSGVEDVLMSMCRILKKNECVTPWKGTKNMNPTTFDNSNDGSSGSDSRVHFTRPILMTMILVCF